MFACNCNMQFIQHFIVSLYHQIMFYKGIPYPHFIDDKANNKNKAKTNLGTKIYVKSLIRTMCSIFACKFMNYIDL